MSTHLTFQQDTIITIKGGKKSDTVKFESWKYWEIVGELTWRGADRNQSYDNAKWCSRAEPGSETDIKISGGPDILLKVKRKEGRDG